MLTAGDVLRVTSVVLGGCPDVPLYALDVSVSHEPAMRDRAGVQVQYVKVRLYGWGFADAVRVAGALGLALVERRIDDVIGPERAWLSWARWVDVTTSTGLPVCVELTAHTDTDTADLFELARAVA